MSAFGGKADIGECTAHVNDLRLNSRYRKSKNSPGGEAISLAFNVSDEVLEIAAGTAKEKANFTLGACTGLSECPG
jgi:hypothetical protein